jgi:hypothetical protein
MFLSPVKDKLNKNADKNYISSCSDIWKELPFESSAK